MLHKTYLGLALLLASGAGAAVRAESAEQFENDIGKLDRYASGFTAARANCAPTLAQSSADALEATMVTPGNFAKSSAAAKVSSLHAIADFWFRAGLADSADAFFGSEFAAQQFGWFVRKVHAFNGVPLMKLRPYAHELHVLATKIETVIPRFVRSRPEYIQNLGNFMERVGRLAGADDSLDHAFRSVVYAQASYLAFTKADDPRTGARVTTHDLTGERKHAVQRALRLLRESIAQDEQGWRLARYVPYAGALLQYLVADYVISDAADKDLVQIDLIEVINDMHRGLRTLAESDEPGQRRRTNHVRGQLDILTRQNGHLARQVPGLIDRIERLKAMYPVRPNG